jgi:hypothetical protein
MLNKNIKVIPFPGLENCYVVISGVKSNRTGNGCEKRMTFFYGDEEGGAEWEPDYGPITRITPCSKDAEKAEPHFFYDYFTGNGNWSQLAVEREGLAEMFLAGDYAGMFSVLKRWAST